MRVSLLVNGKVESFFFCISVPESTHRDKAFQSCLPWPMACRWLVNFTCNILIFSWADRAGLREGRTTELTFTDAASEAALNRDRYGEA